MSMAEWSRRFESDAYGVDTDSPESAYETIDNMLTASDEARIAQLFREFKVDVAREFFATGEWNDEWWDAWNDKVSELIY